MSAVREHLQALYESHGRTLTPDLVVAAARPAEHPLHAYIYDRAPREAAEAWYRHRAGELLRSVRVTYGHDDDGTPKQVRAFHCVHTERGHVYEPVEVVAANEFLREALLRDMEREWRQLHTRYAHFEEFLTMVQETVAV